MKKDAVSRRAVLKTISLSGLVFCGVPGLAHGQDKDKKKIKHWDVVVAGGGPGGVPAAVAAARNGASVLLVEKYGFLGGMATAGLVNPFMRSGLAKGLFSEFADVLAKNGALLKDGRTFDEEPMKWLLDRFVLDSGAEVLFHAQVLGVLGGNGRIEAIRVLHKGGVEDISADVFVDSTGDGDVAAWAGAEFKVGRHEDGACQPMTLCFRMAGVDKRRMPSRDTINEIYSKAKEKGEIENPREDVLTFESAHPNIVHFNTTRVVGKSALDGWSLTDAEIEGRRQAAQMAEFMKQNVAGFEDAYLSKLAPQIGVRESRRIMGEYVLNADDVLSARHFHDGIANCNYDIDIHNPTGTGTVIKRLKRGTYYQIPYRCLVPKRTENVLVGSRCVSSTHEAHSSLRVQPIVWCIGQAAGTAASLCVKNKIKPAALDVAPLRKTLMDQGANI
jgi:hypothetical protein